MKTNHSNISVQSDRVFCSRAKMRLFLLASLPCLIGSVWAGSLPFDLTMPNVLMLLNGSAAVAQPGPTPVGPPIKELTSAPKPAPGPSPDGTPYVEPLGSKR